MLFKTAGLVLWFIAILCCLDKKSRLVTGEYLGAKCVNQSVNFLISSCGSSPSNLPQIAEIEARYHASVV